MPGEDYQSWSTSSAANGTSDSSINWAEGQPRASVNNSARSEMAAHAKNRNLLNGSIVTSGTTNAQNFTSGVGYTVIPTGMMVLLKIGPDLTSVAGTNLTLNMDGIGAVEVKNQRTENVSKGLIAGTYAQFLYDGTNWIWLAGELLTIINNTVINQVIITDGEGGTGSVALVDFTDLDTTAFQRYEIMISGFVPEIEEAFLCANISTDNGVTFSLEHGEYQGIEVYTSQGTWIGGDEFPYTYAQNDQEYLGISWPQFLTDPAFPAYIRLTLFGFEPDISPVIQWENSYYETSDNFATMSDGRGHAILSTGANAIRLWCSVGNIAKAKITLIGWKIA